MSARDHRWIIAATIGIFFALSVPMKQLNGEDSYDVVIYGGTSAGIAAAVQVKRMGGTVIVIEPSERIGGLTTGGLGQTDIGNKAAIGGISREFYQRVRQYYEQAANWKWQQRDDYRGGGQSKTGANEDTMWTFEPSAALKIMNDYVREYEIPVEYQQRLDRSTATTKADRVEGVEMRLGRITRITMESGKSFAGKVFVDATYEGDLMAGAGVTYFVGRESNDAYGETLSGVQTRNAKHHQFVPGVDPYRAAGDRTSGLLPGIDPNGPGVEGAQDHRVQAYCFRMCLTDHPENRIPFAKPSDYDPLQYELLLRNFEAGAKITPWANSGMPNRKTDTNNNRGFSTDFIGQNYEYPDASYQRREQIIQRHRSYQQGLMWTLANHPRVPAAIRSDVSRWGTCKDEFARQDGWQQQLYIREARRMIGDYVMTQHHCQGRETAARPVGMAAYTMDSHNVQRYVNEQGHVRNEGDVQVGGFSPYPIDYGSIIPKENECENLLVPVCLSASHMAFGSIRMEPVFMVLGQSAATAAMQSIREDCSVQQIPYEQLGKRLTQDKQVLIWTGPKRVVPQGIAPETLPGIVVDDEQAERVGFDTSSNSIGPFIASGYRHDGNAAKGRQTVRFRLTIKEAGKYQVRVAWTPFENRATNVPVTIHHAGGKSTMIVNQRRPPNHDAFGTVGTYQFDPGEAMIEINNTDTDGYVLADGVQLLKQ
jgi:hypothetical protein